MPVTRCELSDVPSEFVGAHVGGKPFEFSFRGWPVRALFALVLCTKGDLENGGRRGSSDLNLDTRGAATVGSNVGDLGRGPDAPPFFLFVFLRSAVSGKRGLRFSRMVNRLAALPDLLGILWPIA
jgi:hypothetical protein